MFQEDPLIKRLKELSLITKPTEKEFAELEQIKKDLGMDQDTSEPIPQIKNYRHKLADNRAKEEQLRLLVQERKEIELKLSLRKEKERIQKAKEKLYGKPGQVYCDDCFKWVWPDHFD